MKKCQFKSDYILFPLARTHGCKITNKTAIFIFDKVLSQHTKTSFITCMHVHVPLNRIILSYPSSMRMSKCWSNNYKIKMITGVCVCVCVCVYVCDCVVCE